MKKAAPKAKKKFWTRNKKILGIGIVTLPISMSVGHVLGNVVKRSVPLEPATTAIVRTTEHPSMQKTRKSSLQPELHERWAGMVLGEVGPDAPKTVWRKVARTVPTRMSLPGWGDLKPHEILNERHFYALGSPTLEKRKQVYRNEFGEIKKVIDEELKKPVTKKDPTHFYTTRLLVDGEGKLILDKEGNPIETNTRVPDWATNASFVGDEVWQPKGEPVDKGPVKIKFYRHRS